MKKFYYFLLIGTCLVQVCAGQLNYTFSASSGTYTAITGTVAPLTLGATSDFPYQIPNEGFSNDIPIGFSFRYNDVDYTSINLNTNGFASFTNFEVANENAGEAYYLGNLANGTVSTPKIRPILAPLWDDMDLTDNANLTYITSGLPLNQVFTIQWANVKWPSNATASSISFQLKLYETTNVIEFIYQPFGLDFPDRAGSIGISATATGINNYLSLNNASNNPTASSTSQTTTINTFPADGQIYRFTPAVVLPVTLSNFSGEKRNGINLLNWSTHTELNNSGFELQHSANGSNFSILAFIASKAINGNSTSTLNYEFKDLKPFIGNNYYRLKQIDKDGTSMLSSIVLLRGSMQESITISKIYPNPLKDNLIMRITAPTNEKITIIINDRAGKIVKQQTIILLSGDNRLPLDVAELASGTYMVKVVCASGCETAVSKFVKQ